MQQDKSDWEDDEKIEALKQKIQVYFEEMPQYSYLIEEFIQKNR